GAVGAGAEREVDAVAGYGRSGHALRDRDGPRGAGLLAGQAEITYEDGLGRIAEVVGLRHTPGAPARRADLQWISLGEIAGHQIRGARVALPEILVRRGEPRHDRACPLRLRRIGHVPDLVARAGHCIAERPQEICLALPLADARHLGAALLGAAGRPRDVSQIARPRWVGDLDDRGAVVFLHSGP